MKLVSFVRNLKVAKRLLVGSAFVILATAGVFAYNMYTNNQTEASTCPTNDIMPCGASSPSNFISKLTANNPSSMAGIYAAYNLPASEYANFKNYAKTGVINPNTGNVTINGTTIGYDGLSLGRNSKGSNISTAVSINGKTYYQSHIKDLTKYNNDAMVLFDAQGNVQTVIMNLCGNPIRVTPNNPVYSCNMLNATPASTSPYNDTYNFSSVINASNGATVTKVVYDFGDGQTSTQTSPSTVVSHKYATGKTYTAKVTAYVKTTFGRSEFPITVTANCQKTFPITETPKPSVTITKSVVSEGNKNSVVALNTNYNYILVVTNTGDVNLVNTTITDQAPSNVTFVSTNQGTIVNNALQLTGLTLAKGQSVKVTITAKLTAYTDKVVTNKACVVTPTVPETANGTTCDTANVTTPAPVLTPSVTITKTVGSDKQETMAVKKDTPFTYNIVVHNNGQVDLKDVVVTDNAQPSIVFTQASLGTVSTDGKHFSYTVANLAVDATVTITITAKATAASTALVVNTACVETPTIPGSNPDKCDTASTTTPEPGKVDVCDPTTGHIIRVDEDKAGQYENVNSEKCKVRVCDPADRTIKLVQKDDESKYLPENSDKCVNIVTPPAPKVIASTGPEAVVSGFASVSALTYGAYTYTASRRAVRNVRK